MKRKTKDIQYKINKNALKETRLQYAYDSNGKKMFHGAFEGGNVKEIDKIETEQFEPMGFTYFQGGKGKKIELGIEDIVDDEDGIDFKQKEKEIEKLIKSGMSFVEAQKFLKDIQWDGKEKFSGTAIGRLCIGKDDQSHLNWLNKFISSTQLQNKQQEEKIEKKDNKIERIIQSIEVPILVKERFNI
ncbi:hypothetical protein EHI_171320 [Entamoeba histolytica HM-1:IMSS]|uniref:G patch domain-containing protein n=1 Tax=Entamoeba histolytica (strain ATCC 30459 / HM-1:IMSS / ABRM) TaxID=294381 RepID=B1N404_ENTH1|nr:hypothetical protein EHI_171320 [Entamoeba histolytica HM-1:IMSS]EDS89304.1 hypothetical protein EHI_171320 [Entamoeba histolytica HM-1:IMSS]|eukprot:XP_001913920.1 hypothetical protein EHI_171320 [Entamoeba histolytica HM-1:IMSS]